MKRTMRTTVAGGIAAVLLAACGGSNRTVSGSVAPSDWPVPDRRAACYELRYDHAGAASRFPRLLVLDRGGGSGRAFWFPTSRGDGVWREFYARGHWSRAGRGQVRVRFEHDAVKVNLDLEQRGSGRVVGRGSRQDPVPAGDDVERESTLEGRHVSCPPAPMPEAERPEAE